MFSGLVWQEMKKVAGDGLAGDGGSWPDSAVAQLSLAVTQLLGQPSPTILYLVA